MRPGETGVRTVGHVTQGSAERTAIFAAYRGRGQVVVSGALDAWRFRGTRKSGFAALWQGLIADVAGSAPPRVMVDVQPLLAKPGEEVALRVRVRETEWTTRTDGFGLPPVSAAVVSASGSSAPVRLWPGTSAGEFMARFPAPSQGSYDVRVIVGGKSHDVTLAVRADALTRRPDRGPAQALLAQTSGGAVISATDLDQAVARIRIVDRPVVEHRLRPMRSGWWMVPFAALLGSEWTLRRRKGQR